MRTIKAMMLMLPMAAVSLNAAPSGLQSEIEAFAKNAMARIGTAPGLAVAIVKDDKVIYRGVFGLRDVDAKLPVTPDTRFYMASSTKAFTALAAAIAAQEGKLDLDAPIGTVWPELKLTAPLDPARISLRDLLAMRSGLGNDTVNFRMEVGNVRDDKELMRLLADYSRAEPRTFRYSNLSYVLAGRVMEKAAGKSWGELVSEKILAPLAMTSTTTAAPATGVPVAKCYRSAAPGAFVELPAEIGMAGPAGAMLTTTADAAAWIVAMMNGGRVNGKQVLPRRAVDLVQSQQTTNKRRFRYIDRFAWGLGEDLGDYEGDLIVHRFGGLNGAYSHMSFMPEHRIGVVAFSNGGGSIPDAVAAFAYDRLLGKKNLDAKWTAEVAKVAAAAAQQREQRSKAEAAAKAARRSAGHPLDRYAARYHFDRLGDIDVVARNGNLYGEFGIYRAEMIPTGDDNFLVDWVDRGEAAPVKFVFEGDRAVRLDWGGRIFERVP
jgi:CubicO group peptidase (beta-lactamase class C family)